MKTPQQILDFWFSEDAKSHWFNSTPAFDGLIKDLFEVTATALANGPMPNREWEATADHALALVITHDQFPRNMYRGTKQAFVWDGLSLNAAKRMVDRGQDMELAPDWRPFAYMPFMHSEILIDQNRCVELAGSRLDDGGSTLRHAIAHRDVIERFGRFPHRNETLGRDSTPEEIEFLANGGYDPS